MKTNSTFCVLVLCILLLTFNSPYALCKPPPTKPRIRQNPSNILLIGDHQGIDETTVQSAVLLVAEELRKQGIRIGDPFHETPASGTVYRVVLDRSNENGNIMFRLSKEEPAGTVIIQQEIQLVDIEEMTSVIPRLVYALIHREPILLSSSVVGVSAFTTLLPIEGMSPPGVGIGFHADMLSYAVEIEGRIAGSETEYGYLESSSGQRKDYFHFYLFSVGGRYFFEKKSMFRLI